MLFGVPDEITDMTRSLQMVERLRLIYRTIVFGHRKCSRGYQVHIGSSEGVLGTPGKDMGLMGQEGKRSSQQGLLPPPYGPNQRRKERGEERRKGRDSATPFLPSSLLLPSPSLPQVVNLVGIGFLVGILLGACPTGASRPPP